MAREAQPPHSRLTPRLEADLHRINFYRFCQLLEKRNPHRPLMGSTSHPVDDPVRFAPHPGMGFPASELKAVEYDEDDDSKPPVIRATFMGMYGVDSPLPTAYLDDITQRREGHEALQGFLDIFSHRILTQFYRIWRKYSYPATFEPGGTDTISQSLLGLVGLGIPGTANHIATPVSRFLALLGVLRQPGKTQEGMQALVTLLAPETTVRVSPYCLRPVEVSRPLGFYGDDDFLLDGNTPWVTKRWMRAASCWLRSRRITSRRRRAGNRMVCCTTIFWSCCGCIWAGDSGPESPSLPLPDC